jgi:PREDICTED: similar to hCG2019757
LITFARGAKQFVVQEALETIVSVAFADLWFTPITNIGASAEGAEITTFLAPALM